MNDSSTEPIVAAPDARVSAWRIFADFLKMGLTAFGGPAIIAHIRELAVNRRGWIEGAAFRDGVVLSQSIPGATAMQVAAYVGLKARGVRGAAAAYLGLGLPAFFLMMLLSEFYASSRTVAPVMAVFGGLQVTVVAIVAHAACTFGKDIVTSLRCSALAVVSGLLLLLKVSPFLVIVAAALAGMALFRDIVMVPSAAPPREGNMVRRTLLVSAVAGGIGLVILRLLHPQLFSLSLLMLRINFFAFGGGFSSLPLMHHEIVARGWMESRAFIDGIALGQVTPGPISITGTFIGYLLFGVIGGVVATIATFSPSFILLLVSEPFYDRMKSSQLFARASKGIVSCFVGLLFFVTWKFAADIPWDWGRFALVAAAFVALWRKVDILIIVFIGSLLALLLQF